MGILANFIIRVCPEHLCKLFKEHRLLERMESGEYQFRVESKRKTEVFVDHHNNECWWTDLLFITDPSFPVGHPRHEVAARINRHRTEAGVIGGSGQWDPGKGFIQIEGKLYRKFKTKGGKEPHCELCENGDMIPSSERFYDSTYRPGT
jgi:hypothetical protein